MTPAMHSTDALHDAPPALRGKVALVTGAAGHIGANLTRALLAARCEVRALVYDQDDGVRGLPVQRIDGDVCDEALVRRAAEGADYVFHLAARISIDGDPGGCVHRTNVGGTRSVVAACLGARVGRLIHFSSVHALTPTADRRPLTEEEPFSDENPAPAYNHSKALAEREVLAGVERGLNAVILCPSGVFGPHDHGPSHAGRALMEMWDGRIPANLDGGFDWVDARDVVRSTLQAAVRGRVGQRYLLGGRWRSLGDVARTVAELGGASAPRWSAPMWAARVGVAAYAAVCHGVGAEPLFTGEALHALRCYGPVCSDKAQRELGHAPRPFRDTIADTIAWHQQSRVERLNASRWRTIDARIDRRPHSKKWGSATR